jgi:hypothetical protein
MAATWATADFVAMCGRTVFLPFAQIPGTVVPPAERLCGIGLECLLVHEHVMGGCLSGVSGPTLRGALGGRCPPPTTPNPASPTARTSPGRRLAPVLPVCGTLLRPPILLKASTPIIKRNAARFKWRSAI